MGPRTTRAARRPRASSCRCPCALTERRDHWTCRPVGSHPELLCRASNRSAEEKRQTKDYSVRYPTAWILANGSPRDRFLYRLIRLLDELGTDKLHTCRSRSAVVYFSRSHGRSSVPHGANRGSTCKGIERVRSTRERRDGYMARRGRSEGSIHQQTDGRWVAAVSVGYRNGRRQRKRVYGKTRGAVAKQLKRSPGPAGRWACRSRSVGRVSANTSHHGFGIQ